MGSKEILLCYVQLLLYYILYLYTVLNIITSLTMLAVAVCIPVRNKNSPKDKAMHRFRWTKL